MGLETSHANDNTQQRASSMTTIAIKRDRINAEELHDGPRKSKQTALRTTKTQRLLFACVPAPICGDPRSHDLSPLEIAVAGTLLALARVANTSKHHKKAFKVGQERIAMEGTLHAEWRAQWRAVKRARKRGQYAEAPQRYHANSSSGDYKPVKIKQAMQDAGTIGFRRAMKVLRGKPLPERTVFSVSRSALLRHVGLSRCMDNLNAIDDALATLSEPARTG